MKHLSSSQVEQLTQSLKNKLTQLTQFQESVEEANPVNDPERLVDNSEMGDEALEGDQILQNDVLSDESKHMIAEVQAALDRMKKGTYGIDEETGAEIPFARLTLVPTARTAAPRKK